VLSRNIVWEWVDRPGLEYLSLNEDATGVSAARLILVELEKRVVKLRYTLKCDSSWRFLQATLTMEFAGKLERRLSIEREEESGNWLVNGQRRTDLDACSYIDIMVTPFTNTLPIRNLGLKVGQPRAFKVAYIKVPELEVTVTDQEYTRLDSADPPTRFLYRNLSSSFTAELTVDSDGIVTNYPGPWRRISS